MTFRRRGMRLVVGDPPAIRPAKDEEAVGTVPLIESIEPDGPFRRAASWVVR
jgi:hypothetical protein